jgi:hypothetical protein
MDFQMLLLMHNLLAFTMGLVMAMDSMVGIWDTLILYTGKPQWDNSSRQMSTLRAC